MTALALLLGAAALVFVAAPLLRARAEPDEPEESPPGAGLGARKDTLYEGIKDLDFEYAQGKVGEGDYRAVRAAMVGEAAAVLEQLEAAGAGGGLDQRVEAEVAASRSGGISCPSCRRANPARASFCDGCGTALAPAPCRACGAAQRSGAGFCQACGKKL